METGFQGLPLADDHDEHDMLPPRFWELYDLEADRTENYNLASQYPEMVNELATEWQAWAEGANAVPKPPRNQPNLNGQRIPQIAIKEI